MRIIAVGLAALALMAAGARAEVLVHGPKETAEAILKADRDFDALSASEGTAKAFRAYMDATDGLVFAGHDPVRGGEAIYRIEGGDAPPKTRLHWEPSEVFASTGDMGVTWGRWVLTATGSAKPLITGRYVTVWRRNAKGEWKGVIDIGDHD